MESDVTLIKSYY